MKHILIFIFLAVSSGVCFGDDVLGQEARAQSNTCSSDEDCYAAAVGCGSWMIVNKDFEKIQEKSRMGCESTTFLLGPKPLTACIDHVCVAKWKACSQNSDCTAGAVNCQNSSDTEYSYWQPVNKKFVQDMEDSERKDSEKDVVSTGLKVLCATSEPSGPKPEAQCVDMACELDSRFRGNDNGK